jgi:hypothetical protein
MPPSFFRRWAPVIFIDSGKNQQTVLVCLLI